VAVVGTAYVVVQAITTGFTQQVQNALQGLNQQGSTSGNSVGKSFSRGAASGLSSADDAALELYKRLNLLIEKSYVMSAAGVALAQVLSTVASGLVVLVAQVGAAAPALIVLPSMFTAIAQAAITMKMAFKGIGAAVGSINKGSKGVSQMPALLEAASAAKDRLTRAKRSVIKAGERIIEVYDDELERIEQLKFSSEGAALSQKKAAIELEKARETLARVQDLPPNSRARRSAELAFAEADLNYRQAVDRNKDLSKEVDKVTQNGTLNKDQQVKNSKAYKDAVEAETDAVYEREKAQEAKNKADAKVASGGSGGGADPMADLGESAKEFAKYLASLKPLIDDLRVKIQDTLFPKLKDAIEILVKSGLFEILNEKLADTGTAIGNAAIDFAKLFSNPTNLKNFSDVLDTNNETIEKMGTVLGNLTTSFITLLDAASPLITRFTDWVVTLTNGWQKTLDAKNAGDELTTTFNNAGDVAAQLGDIFGNLFGAIMNIGKAATGPGSGGQLLFDFLEEATAKFKEWTGGALKDGSLEAFFKTTTENFIKLLEIIGIVVAAILKTGDDPGVSKFFDSLKNAVQTLADALGNLSEGGITEGFGKFIDLMARLIATTTESGSIKTYFGILNVALGLLLKLMENPVFQKGFAILATIHGARLAFGRLGWAVNLSKDYMVGAANSVKTLGGKLVGIGGAAKGAVSNFQYLRASGMGVVGSLKMMLGYTKLGAAATKAWTGIQAAFNAVMSANPIMLTVIAIIALIAIVVIMYNKFEWFRDLVDAVWSAIKTGAEAAFNWLKDNWPLVLAILLGPFGLLVYGVVKYWDEIVEFVKKIPERLRDIGKTIWSWITDRWTDVRTAISTRVSEFVDFVRGLPERVRNAAAGIWDGIKNGFKNMLNSIIGWWNDLSFSLNIPKNRITDFLGINGLGFTLNTPNIPPLAEGGVIRPSQGGTLARIGEAGRAERIEPLDASGLSKRDRALITMLSGGTGGAGGINITVNPSPGMDEVELASLVSRQLAFQLRRGAA
jgi:hypothetical protein